MEFYKISEVAKILRLSKLSVYRLISNGDLIAFKIRKRGHFRVDSNELKRFIERRNPIYKELPSNKGKN